MKKILTCCILTILTGSAYAQQLSLGLRTGTACWTEGKEDKGYKVQSLHVQAHTWDNEVFAQFTTKSKWAFETGLNYSFFNQGQVSIGPWGDKLSTHVDNYEWNISAQYDLTCSHMQQCPLMKKMKSYIGVSLTPTWSSVNNHIWYGEPSYNINEADIHSTSFHLWTGLSHTITFPLSRHVLLTSVFDFKLAPDRFFSSTYKAHNFEPTTRTGIRIGAAYKL